MLKLSTKSSYGLRACLTLAKSETRLSSTEIAAQDSIPQRYLEQILSALRKSGLVNSVRGAKGGYSLSKSPGEISVADLVRSVEGELPPMLCTNPELRSSSCREDSSCDSRVLCSELENSVSSILSGTTLADILSQRKSLNLAPTGQAHAKDHETTLVVASPSLENKTR